MTNVVNVVMMDMIFSNCTSISVEEMNMTKTYLDTSMMIIHCYDVFMQNVMILSDKKFSLLAVNVLGKFTIDRLKSTGIQLLYDDDVNITNGQDQSSNLIRIVLISIVQNIKDYVSLLHYAYISLYDTRFFEPFEDFTFNNRNFQEIFYGISLKLYQTYNVKVPLQIPPL